MCENKIYDEYEDSNLQQVIQKLGLDLKPEIYRSERVSDLWKLRDEGFEPLAWCPNVKYLFYNPKRKILIHDVEGDLYIWRNPTDETLKEQIQRYKKGHVSLGEKYDPRFKLYDKYNEEE